MKKLLLSALAISTIFASCCKKDEVKDCPKTPDNVAVSTSPTGVFSDIAFVQSKMSSSPQLAKEVYDSFKDKLATTSRSNPEEIRTQLGDWILEINSSTATATQGTAGKLGKRYVNAKGIEPEQLVKKGLIGAYQLNEALSATFTLQQGNPDKEQQQKIFDKFVTALIGSTAYLDAPKGKMFNHKKEIIGYPEMAGNEFTKYLNGVASNPAFSSISDEFYATLKDAKGKVGNKAELSDALKKARNMAAKVVAIRCVHYFKKYIDSDSYKKKILDVDSAHGISEGIGFYYSLQFTYGGEATRHSPYVTNDKVEDLLENLDLWNTDNTRVKLNKISEDLAKLFGFSVEDARK